MRDPGKIKALLFDLGGVVIEIDFRRCMSRWATSAGESVEEITSRFRFDAAYEEHERGFLDASQYFEHLRRVLSVDLADDVLLEGWVDIYVAIDAEVLRLLEKLKPRLPLYAFTNSNPSHQAVWSERFARELAVFDRVFVSSEMGERKPDRVAFEVVASAVGIAPSSILFFDDSPENVEGARSVGMEAVHVASPDSVRDALRRFEARPTPSAVTERH